MRNPESSLLSWVHFGDLHIQGTEDENYQDFRELIAEVNDNLAGEIDFAFLPGDSADDGTEAQYRLVQSAVRQLKMPVYAITGDHDKKSGALDLFQRYLEPDLYQAIDCKGFRLLFLNALDGERKDSFDFSGGQVHWLKQQLLDARSKGLLPIFFTHLYPAELETCAEAVSGLIRDFGVELVEMGHTHYNEIANDGHTIYAATRSTGQIEEGPPGVPLRQSMRV